MRTADILNAVMPIIMQALPDDILKKGVDALLDMAEEAIEKSENKIDDAVLLPAISLIRSTFDIDVDDEW